MILGAQLYTLRNYCRTLNGLDETLKRVSDMGYTSVQLSGTCEYDGEWMAEKLNAYGLVCPVTHYNINKITQQTSETIALHKAFGAKYIGVGSVPFARSEFNERNFDLFIDSIKSAVSEIHSGGLKFSYHNHDMEMGHASDGKTYLQRISRAFAPDELVITLDTYWVQAGGGDPASVIKSLKGRTPCVHFKDMLYDNSDSRIRIAPIGEGNMNYDGIISACLECGVDYGFVELDECYGADPFECMARSYRFLTQYGLK